MMYEIDWKLSNSKSLLKLPNPQKIVLRVQNYLRHAPKELGKPLTGEYKGLYRYRFGDYRVIYKVDVVNKRVIIMKIGHRREIYE